MKVAVVGGGASGVFAAISAKRNYPNAQVTIFEKSNELLHKVKISGGGRCNVTHNSSSIAYMSKCYPRGGKQLKKLFQQFFTSDTIRFFEDRGVKLKSEADNRMFPITDNSQTIIDCLIRELHHLGVQIKFDQRIQQITSLEHGFRLSISNKQQSVDKVIVATGGSPNSKGLTWLQDMGYKIEQPVPSLFTFNMKKNPITQLMGVVANPVKVRVVGFDEESVGPLLVTHWGMSGPAILKLSAFAARFLNESAYEYEVRVNWCGEISEHELREDWSQLIRGKEKAAVHKKPIIDLPQRLWTFLLEKANIRNNYNWSNLPKKEKNRLIEVLVNDSYQAKGKTTFKEEFVTAGGVSWSNLNPKTMESKLHSGLYFAGEVVDMDGITGGFNFQAAWTTGFVAGQLNT
jgi:predicted Rossmann fold flavoprotein